MRNRDQVSFTAAEWAAVRVVLDHGEALLGKRTDPDYKTIDSRIAKRLKRAGVFHIDHAATATLTAWAADLIR